MAKIRNPTVTPSSRFRYSVHISVGLNCDGSNGGGNSAAARGGIQEPKQRGQSGQPRPAPDARTSPPTRIKRYVVAVVVSARRWNVENRTTNYYFNVAGCLRTVMTARARPRRTSTLRRVIRYRLIVPMIRSVQAPECTARGVAVGVFWALTPLLGLQTLLMIASWQFLKHVLRKDTSLVQALIWSWVNNPATMIPMYYAFYVTGLWLLGSPTTAGGYRAFADTWHHAAREPTLLAQLSFVAHELGLALMVGCLPWAIVATTLMYHWTLKVTRRRQRRIGTEGAV